MLQDSCKSSSVTPPLQLDKTSQAQQGPMPNLSPQQGSNQPGEWRDLAMFQTFIDCFEGSYLFHVVFRQAGTV